MNIGIAAPSDIRTFLPFFSNEIDKRIISENNFENSAPAVNTLIISFLKSGHFVRLFTLSTSENFVLKEKNIEIFGVKNYDTYPGKYIWGHYSNATRLKPVLANNLSGLDVLHAQWTYCYAYAASGFTDKIPVFCTVRDWTSIIWKMESLKNKITWSVNYIMNKQVFSNRKINFIANSQYTASLIKKKYKREVPVIPNSIKDDFMRMGSPEYPENLEILCISSSNDKRKNIKTLLYAFQKIAHKYPKAHLNLIGPPFYDSSRDLKPWKQENLLKNVSLHGKVNHKDLIDFIDRARLFVTPSLEETFGNTLLESLSRKVPVIAGKNSGAIPYVLDNGRLGLLCDVSKWEEIYQAIEFLYLNPKEAQSLAEKGFELIFQKYSEVTICNQHIDLYSNIDSHKK
ncbi:glycosyltransferase family 4 protein [Mangrovibacterium sp.]|uniref:glycosyltransferase family 4 protein n=1 Tax=Mangrovibacterium sp. TaxID=1961364 RepID=UPI003568F2BD